ncbi:alpha/beta-hydrolase [Cyathus striatus]|nr:alpha/beta-hydrolase [Cyathus striatus]
MRFPFTLLGLSTQLQSFFSSSPHPTPETKAMAGNPDFAFKEGADVFSPKDLVELGRPGAAVANLAGDLALVSFSKYSFDEKKNKKSVFVVPLESDAKPLEIPLEKGGETFWLASHIIGNVVANDEKSEVYAIDVTYTPQAADSSQILQVSGSPKLIGTIPTPSAANFRYHAQHLVFSENVYSDGNLTPLRSKTKNGMNAEIRLMCMILPTVRLSQDPDRNWIFGEEFFSPLKGTKHNSPVEPFGGTDDFDVSATHIIYTTKDPKLPEAWHTKQNVYIVDIEGKEKPKELTSGKQGATHSPVFNNAGTKAAWLELDEDGYESDRAKIVIYDLQRHVRFTLTQNWDRSPDALAFSKEDDYLYFTADVVYWALLFSQSSLTSPNDVFIIHGLPHANSPDLDISKTDTKQLTQFTAGDLKHKNLSKGEEFWFKGALEKDVQGWALKPRGWQEGDKKKWPVVLLIHGGPQGAWEDQWSTRWNPNVFTQQGYFVIMINPTGSTTFGQEFTDAIAEDWGGKPFVDMIEGWKYALNKYTEIDPDRAVAAGASWGGYAINWIQGHPEYGFNFKALVGHDGVFDSNYNGYSTDELFFAVGNQEQKTFREPANYVHKWSTPQLLVHGSKDYRLPETESIGAFHALQQLGVPSRLVVFPDENHWVLNHGNSLKWHYEVFRWFDQFVGDKA